METRRIEPRHGAEIYVGELGHVCIKQHQDYGGENIVILHAEEVPELIEHLKAACQEALDFVPEENIDSTEANRWPAE